jgi:hypothetical protein
MIADRSDSQSIEKRLKSATENLHQSPQASRISGAVVKRTESPAILQGVPDYISLYSQNRRS